MELITKLKEQYSTNDVPPFGECIVIPEEQMDPQLRTEIANNGYDLFHENVDEKPVFIILPKPTETKNSHSCNDSPSNKPELSKEKTSNIIFATDKEYRWKKEEDEFLIRFHETERSRTQIIELFRIKFPKRSVAAIHLRLNKLIKAGKIISRKQNKTQTTQKTEENQGNQEPKTTSIQSQQTITLELILEKLDCQTIMSALQAKEQAGTLKIPKPLFAHYANAILQNNQESLKIFKEKTTKLLEASE
jgi:hypothetical protein